MRVSLEALLKALPKCSIFDTDISKNQYVALDLSITNNTLKSINVTSSEALENYINSHIKSNGVQIAFGGYLETRNIYQRSNYFNNKNPETERNIHLGLDLWIAAKTPIYSPLDGVVHSFKNNTNFGDYGPTIILEHKIKGISFYTLYGHLSLASIQSLKVGQVFEKGDQIATLGDASVNGDYPPHLHFQIIKDIQDYVGDYPGVCSKQDLEFYRNNCPDPLFLLDF
ncbi:peptidoglycan DD-metalloendopeptidase family protein [Psychroserpens ponticola]|uniref:Peptidoglycan DD-metalloendopeptidase family protein n=1 Tax=Psychroserpens ponticola TaxID=2932268 RepID=A0ABY7RZD5_9FLAO|nr:peptidoglycan DD-metalloendopeptidase family protein [Psychroserpens ponticola]WCO02500.1 peptidoglycan DD-metalloendopeptidase family protein [Psychroserpens ponticola]